MKVSKNILIKIGIIIVIIIGVIYNVFISKDNSEEIVYSEIFVNENKEDRIIENETKTIKVYVTGEVNNPGVIELEENSRIEDAINIAGGLTNNANLLEVNLAYHLEDGQKLYIPNINDKEGKEYITIENGEKIVENSKSKANSKININKGDIEELKKLPGVGDSLAQRIISYRKENGQFKSIEDLKNVSGIGEKKFESLKEYIEI